MTATSWACQFRAPSERPESTLLSRSFSPRATAGLGHGPALLLTEASGRCRLGQETFARTSANG
jgi:hypothetical protein